MSQKLKQGIFLIVPIFFSGLITALIAQNLVYDEHWIWLDAIWLTILTVLNYQVILVTIGAVFSFLPNKYKNSKVGNTDKKAVLIYSVKNEYGLAERMLPSVLNNQGYLSEVVIISNSNETQAVDLEKEILHKISAEYGIKATFFQGLPPKQIALYSWCNSRTDIEYFITSDADSFYPKDAVKKLLLRAEHPDNSGTTIFQSAIYTFRADTLFNRFLSVGQELSGRLYAVGFTTAMGDSGYYGSGALIRMADFLKMIQVVEKNRFVPINKILSHDVWEAATLLNQGKHIQYLPDIITFEEFPHTYIDMVKQSGRWLRGTMQSRKMLRIFGLKNKLSAVFLVVFPISMYAIQPFFLLWLILGFVRIFYSHAINPEIHLQVTAIIFSLVFGQKFLAVRNIRQIFEVVIESIASTIIYINTPIFNTVAFIKMWLLHSMPWVPMQKVFKPYSFLTCMSYFFGNMMLGIIVLTVVYFYRANEVVWLIPIFGSLSISGFVAYLSQYNTKKIV